MKEELVTVVVPVYQAEKYLNRCVTSIVNQTYRNLEIILVDDGSPDSCPQQCDRWAGKDRRIKVIHKQNQGSGLARNTGIEHATGAYICFFNSDDYIAPDTIALAFDLAQKESADTVIFGLAAVDTDGTVRPTYLPKTQKSAYAGEAVRAQLLPAMIGADPETGESAGLPLSACCQLISMDLIRRTQWRFVSEREIISEDIYSIIALYAHVQKAAVLPRILYYYCENLTSLSHSYRTDRYEQTKKFYIELIALCKNCGYSAAAKRRCEALFLGGVISDVKQETAHRGFAAALPRLRAIIDDELLQKTLRSQKNGKTGIQRRILFWALRHKQYTMCYALLAAKNAAGKRL